MAPWALALCVLYLALAFGGRTLLQLRATGSTGFKGIGGRPGSPEWLGVCCSWAPSCSVWGLPC